MNTLTALFKQRSTQEEKGIVFCDAGKEDNYISYSRLYNDSLKLLAKLQSLGIKRGDFLIIQTKSNTEFVLLFWAGILGGIIPVPLTYAKTSQMVLKLKNVSETLKNYYIIGDHKLQIEISNYGYNDLLRHYQILNYDEILNMESSNVTVYDSKAEDLAFIQFSSGSTGNPKGVILTHSNLITNIPAFSSRIRLTENDRIVSWLPLTHDMGLIGALLSAVLYDIKIVLIDTMNFLFSPSIYLDKITSYKSTVTAAPNFCFDYVINYYNKKKHKVEFKWELSSLRCLICGAEPINLRAIENFENTLSIFGLKRKVVLPVYGLAEATLAVSFTDINKGYQYKVFDRNALNIGDTAKFVDSGNGVPIVGEGRAIPDIEISIRDENENVLPQGSIGIIYLKGASVTQGYINNPEETKLLFSKDRWLNTNDIGIMISDELYVIGRKKEIIFLNGQNYYPADLERLIKNENGYECAIVGENSVEKGKDVIYIFTILKDRSVDKKELSEQIKSIIRKHVGIPVEQIVFVSNFPRTTSGKIRRFLLLKEARKRGEL